MRTQNIPRGIPASNAVAQPMEIGAGMSDRRTGHVAPIFNSNINNQAEREWFQDLEKRSVDPRDAPSSFHDPVLNVMPDKSALQAIEEVILAEGKIIDAFMMLDGAHLKIQDANDDVYVVFSPKTPFVALGSKVKIVDTIVKHTSTYSSSKGEPFVDETHSITVLEMDNEDESPTEE